MDFVLLNLKACRIVGLLESCQQVSELTDSERKSLIQLAKEEAFLLCNMTKKLANEMNNLKEELS